VGNLAFFAGGRTGRTDNTVSNIVDIFNADTGQWSTAALSQSREYLSATSVGDYALFAGGAPGNFVGVTTVDLFDIRTGSWSTASLSVGRWGIAATSAGQYALFAGGDSFASRVDIFNASTQQWSTATLSTPRAALAATSVGQYALFAGGLDNSPTGVGAEVDIFNANTGQWTTATLSIPRDNLAATSVGHYALFGGGFNGTGHIPGDVYGEYSTVDVFDSDTGQWSVMDLSVARGWLAATTLGNEALFAGGGNSSPYRSTVDIYNDTTGQWSIDSLSVARRSPAATAVGDYALFAGGATSGYIASNVVDIYTIVPEPSAIALLGMGVVGLLAWTWRRAKINRILLCLFALLFSSAEMVRADNFAATINSFGSGGSGGLDSVYGWSFIPTTNIYVTQLGVLDYNSYYYGPSKGLYDPHPVGIWNCSDPVNLLVSTTVPSGTSATLVDYIRYEPVTPTLLMAGTEYVIGAYYPIHSPPFYGDLQLIAPYDGIDISTDPNIVFVKRRALNEASGLRFPTIVTTGGIEVGPSFQFTPVPEPSTLALLGMGSIGLVAGGWRRWRENRAPTTSRVELKNG
jgi:hypothetical protein